MKFAFRPLNIILFFLFNFFFLSFSFADNHNIYEIIDQLKKDIKTLEKAVYSESLDSNENLNVNNLNSNLDENSEDVLTKHLLKLSEIENQFQQLTNKFEEINFKLDKLSNRLSKVQADNQIRFQDLEASVSSGESINKITKKLSKDDNNKMLPGSSVPQDLGSISYKDTETKESKQKMNFIMIRRPSSGSRSDSPASFVRGDDQSH